MLTTSIIAIITCILLIVSVLFLPKIKIRTREIHTYWIVCLIGAIFMLIFNDISFKDIYQSFTSHSNINPIKILILFFSMTLLSIFLDEVGFFKLLATNAAHLAKKSQIKLFIILYILTSLLTIFTSNDIVILTFTPFICYFCKNAHIDPKPYLVGEFAAANTWSMMLIIGNPTNIYLATAANIDFISYLKVMLVPTLLAGIVQLAIIYLLFRKKLNIAMNSDFEEHISNDKLEIGVGLFHLIICLLLLVISSYINIPMWIISLVCAISLFIIATIISLINKKGFKHLISTLKRAPYELIPFVLSMFVIVAAINKQNISGHLSKLLENGNPIFAYGLSSFLMSNVMNNIPMSVLFSTLPNMSNSLNSLRATYATIIGSNIGAFLSPIGALAGIMFTQLLNKYDVDYGFKTFIKYGFIVAIPTLLTSLLMLFIIL
ncbi:MAG: hypothetical protein J1F32_06505 [Erysipelotrichales bacterium]|nr:hypothetical protein [Erysipelotrichales bacterium]